LARELFDESRRRPEKPDGVRSRTLEVHFWLFQAVTEGATTEIGMENSRNLKWLSREFQFVELGRQVGAFVSQHHHVEAVPLKSANSDLQKQPAGQNRELCLLSEANGRARAERDSQLEGLRESIDGVAKNQRHKREKVSGPQEAMGKMWRQIESVTIKLSRTDDAVEWRVGPLERVETKDRTSRFESDVTRLRAVMADRIVKVVEVRREVAV
jgi:hypothetical protein